MLLFLKASFKECGVKLLYMLLLNTLVLNDRSDNLDDFSEPSWESALGLSLFEKDELCLTYFKSIKSTLRL